MFLPTGEHHVLLMRDRRQTLHKEAELVRRSMPIVGSRTGFLRHVRRALGDGVIALGQWIRGPEIIPARRPVTSPR